MLLGTLGASLLGNILAGKGLNRARKGLLELVMEIKEFKKQLPKNKIMKTKWISNATSSFK